MIPIARPLLGTEEDAALSVLASGQLAQQHHSLLLHSSHPRKFLA
jgi:hypothetical protein